MMKLMMASAVGGMLLIACGGGGEESRTPANPAPPVRVEPGIPPEGNGSTDKPGTRVNAPPLDSQAMTFSSPSIHLTTNAASVLVKSASVSNLELSGSRNRVWVSEGQAMNTIAVSGATNTIVMMPGATANSFTVDAGNTVYLPTGSPITVLGGATVRYYSE